MYITGAGAVNMTIHNNMFQRESTSKAQCRLARKTPSSYRTVVVSLFLSDPSCVPGSMVISNVQL